MHKVFEHHVVAMCFHRLHRSFPYKISPFVFHGKKIWSEWVNDGCFYFWVNYPHGLCYCSEVNIEREIHQLTTVRYVHLLISVSHKTASVLQHSDWLHFFGKSQSFRVPITEHLGFPAAVSKHYGLKMSECHCIRYYYNLHICIQMCKIFYLS